MILVFGAHCWLSPKRRGHIGIMVFSGNALPALSAPRVSRVVQQYALARLVYLIWLQLREVSAGEW